MRAPFLQRPFERRELLRTSCLGFGGLALSSLLARDALAQSPSAVRVAHHAARAKRMIFLFMHGGPSQVDTFDYKPLLQRDDGMPFPGEKPRIQFAKTGNLLASPWKFAQHGQSGQWVSELFPNVARHVDKLCIVKSLHGTNEAHGGALLALHTGSDTFVRPSMGSWILYGLGSENENLPGFVTICPTLGHGGVNNWSSAFLPGANQGTPIGHAGVPARDAKLLHLARSDARMDLERAELDFLATLNEAHRSGREYDEALAARIASFELAYRMQAVAPEALDVESESAATRELYGLGEPTTENFGRQCLMARRLVERGVRFVQCTHSYKWDQHANLKADHAKNAREVDLPIAGLLADLDARGLLEDTLVLWGGEFGRSPCAQDGNGRDHNPHGFTVWMAGAGLKAGHAHGATDNYGWYAVEGKVHVHDLHATILDLFGLDHERLTFRHAGRDFRLTDVAGRVVRELYA
ncbi:MAG: DUF1501 domain-containing protein [Planctomycetota bacterium]|nr:MAG: DUF1501 domain-containing protein [Planctomycetota bacterium]